MDIDLLWKESLQLARSKERLPTLKGKASAKVISVEEEGINLELDNGNSISLEVNDFKSALAALEEYGRVRQKFVKKPLVERYVLGILKLLPQFEAVKEYDGDKLKTFIKFR